MSFRGLNSFILSEINLDNLAIFAILVNSFGGETFFRSPQDVWHQLVRRT